MAIYKLGEVSKIYSGGDMPKNTFKFKNNVYKYKIIGNGINEKSILGWTNNWTMQKNTITISARGTIGYVSFQKENFTPIVRLISLLPNLNFVYPKYLFYKLNNLKFPFTGAVQKQLTIPLVKEIKISLPNLKIQKQIIDIIEPIEKLENQIDSLVGKTLLFISKIESNNNTFTLQEVSQLKKDKNKKIKQVSAKVLNKRTSLIKRLEENGTYKTNTFFCKKNTLLINTIRTYLEKWCILPIDADVNGTLAQLKVKEKHSSIINNLMNDNFWKQAINLSKGTKMPVLSKKDLLENIILNDIKQEIKDIFNFLSILNNMKMKTNNLKQEIISTLIK